MELFSGGNREDQWHVWAPKLVGLYYMPPSFQDILGSAIYSETTVYMLGFLHRRCYSSIGALLTWELQPWLRAQFLAPHLKARESSIPGETHFGSVCFFVTRNRLGHDLLKLRLCVVRLCLGGDVNVVGLHIQTESTEYGGSGPG